MAFRRLCCFFLLLCASQACLASVVKLEGGGGVLEYEESGDAGVNLTSIGDSTLDLSGSAVIQQNLTVLGYLNASGSLVNGGSIAGSVENFNVSGKLFLNGSSVKTQLDELTSSVQELDAQIGSYGTVTYSDSAEWTSTYKNLHTGNNFFPVPSLHLNGSLLAAGTYFVHFSSFALFSSNHTGSVDIRAQVRRDDDSIRFNHEIHRLVCCPQAQGSATAYLSLSMLLQIESGRDYTLGFLAHAPTRILLRATPQMFYYPIQWT